MHYITVTMHNKSKAIKSYAFGTVIIMIGSPSLAGFNFIRDSPVILFSGKRERKRKTKLQLVDNTKKQK